MSPGRKQTEDMADKRVPKPRKKATTIQPAGARTRKAPPRYDAVAASERFVRAMTWMTVIGLLFVAGQGIRWYAHTSQLNKINSQLQAQYASVLGEDVGASPFGRLQFLHGQATARETFGLDPLAMLAAFSRHADFMVRVDRVDLVGESGIIAGAYMQDPAAFEAFMAALGSDEEYDFELESRQDALSGILFKLSVGRR